jgi:3-methylcrotonyl-CoA carboxylase alpha subunit
MGEAAVAIATAGKYRGAGTVEFLLQDGEFYLLEVNNRLQVEHPVTEEVLGIDLVKMQILTAQGEYIHDPKAIRVPKGHSIECRIYAEDPYLGGVPSTGLLGKILWPEGPGRRFEYGFEAGDTITSYYDPMIAKVIVRDETRSRAIQKMIRVLKDSVVFGVRTNIPYLIEILGHKEFVMGTMTTRFIENHFSEPLVAPSLTEQENEILKGALAKLRTNTASGGVSSSPWQGYWRGV